MVNMDTELYMEVEGEGEEEKEGEGTLMALGSTRFLMQEEDPIRTTLIDARNRFNNMSCLAMIWTVQHC